MISLDWLRFVIVHPDLTFVSYMSLSGAMGYQTENAANYGFSPQKRQNKRPNMKFSTKTQIVSLFKWVKFNPHKYRHRGLQKVARFRTAWVRQWKQYPRKPPHFINGRIDSTPHIVQTFQWQTSAATQEFNPPAAATPDQRRLSYQWPAVANLNHSILWTIFFQLSNVGLF